MDEAAAAQFISYKNQADVILLGTGARSILLSPSLRKLFRSNHINLDTMDTGAACRTFNVLTSEGRRVVAFLMIV
jgi:uncharacterized protein